MATTILITPAKKSSHAPRPRAGNHLVAFSPDGLAVLTASRDGTAIIWQAKEWREKTVAIVE
jgi:hypothetical protein